MSLTKALSLAHQLTTLFRRAVNHAKRRRYLEDPSDAIAGDHGRVQSSARTFSELAEQSEPD